jgi:hypothetical protein
VSVRPAAAVLIGSFATLAMAALSASWTLRAFFWICQPKNPLPSYSIPAAKRSALN